MAHRTNLTILKAMLNFSCKDFSNIIYRVLNKATIFFKRFTKFKNNLLKLQLEFFDAQKILKGITR
jgi:hypothetical protein